MKQMDNIRHTAKEIDQAVQGAHRPWYLALRQTRFLLGIYLLSLALFGALAVLVSVHPLLPVDVAITQEFQENSSPWLRTFMLAVSYPGTVSWVFTTLILLAIAAFWLFRFHLEAVTLALTFVGSSLLNLGVKLLVERPRPTQPLVEVLQSATGKSFPSGHVMSYIAFWGMLFTFGFILFHGKHWWRIALLIVSGLFVVLIGPSRIYLGDHWASDVLGAYLLGGLWLWTALWIYIRLKERQVLATPSHVDAMP